MLAACHPPPPGPPDPITVGLFINPVLEGLCCNSGWEEEEVEGEEEVESEEEEGEEELLEDVWVGEGTKFPNFGLEALKNITIIFSFNSPSSPNSYLQKSNEFLNLIWLK